jgi:hypothetical protein
MVLLSALPGDTSETALIWHLFESLGCVVIESIRSLVRSKSAEVRVEQFKGSFAVSRNCRSLVLALLPLVEVKVSVGAMLS